MTAEPSSMIVAFFAGLVAATYGSAVGGGALMTVPALMYAGLSPVAAVATSRLGSMGVLVSGLWVYGRQGRVDWKLGAAMAVLLSGGAVVGARMLLIIPSLWVERSVAILILLVLSLLLVFPTVGLTPLHIPKDSLRYRLGYVLTLGLGFVAGFYQGGGGTMAAYIMILFFGQTFLDSAGTRKFPFLISNTITIGVLIPSGAIQWDMGIALGLGTLLGGAVGSKLALSKGNLWVRRLFLVVVGTAGCRMLWKSFFL